MNSRTRTIASFFSIAMAAMLLGAVVTTQIQHPERAQARVLDPTTPASAPPVGPGGSITLDTFKEIARRVMPGVVNINTSKTVRRQRMRDPFRDFFGDDLMDRFFGPQGGGNGGGGGSDRQTQTSLGSGFVIDKDGYILTNRHVIQGADQISVTFGDSTKRYEAKVIGQDARTDVAVIKIDASNLPALELGDSDKLEVAEWVMAIGNPFGLGGNSVTVGVVSYKGRNIPLTQGTGVDMIQTDASINPGNSGGPLLNTHGQVIGINTLIITQGVPQSAGVGFAVPINVPKEILPQLREKGKVTRGWLGVQIQSLSEDMAKTYKGLKDAKGAQVSEVTPGSPAEKAGLKVDDVVVGVDGHRVEDNNDLSRYIASKAPGTTVKLEVLREGAEKAVSVTLGTFPEEGEQEETEEARKGKLGMTLRDLTPNIVERLDLPRTMKGVVVMDVEAGEAAERAGIQRGDVIVSVNGVSVDGVDAFEREIDKAKSEGRARLRIRRANSYLFLVLNFK
jgi:serine protease Do